MKVRALKTIDGYYPLIEGQEYEVYGMIYFATPYFSQASPTEVDVVETRGFINPVYSYGVIRNELIYIIESTTQTDRQTFMRFNASNFDVIDERVPVDWRTSAIDLHEEVVKVKLLFQEAGSSVNEFTGPLQALKAFKAKVVVSGADKLHDFEYLHELCDDSLGE